MTRAARVNSLVSLVRIFSPEEWVIERYMGRGVDGIVVPRLETAAQAMDVVKAVRYCYPKNHQEKIIVAQIETRSALETLDEFLRVDGIDVYFIGPVDLAKSLGFEGDFRRPQVQGAINAAIEKIRSADKVAGILVDRENTRGYVDIGVGFLYGHANDFLALGAEYFAHKMGDC
jgi:2-keto-3-deoxy-L-rhamnonate aldolase RhmA